MTQHCWLFSPKASLMSKGTELERSLFLKYEEEFAEDFGAALEVL